MRLAATITIIVGALLAGCKSGDGTPPTQSVGPPPAGVQPVTPSVRLSAIEAALGTDAVSTAFNFGALDTLWVRLVVPSVGTPSRVSLVLTAPTGVVGYETEQYYSSAADPQPITKGSEPPVTVYRARPIAGGFAIDVPVAIAGSSVTRYAATAVGTWTVEGRVDGTVMTTQMTVTYTR